MANAALYRTNSMLFWKDLKIFWKLLFPRRFNVEYMWCVCSLLDVSEVKY